MAGDIHARTSTRVDFILNDAFDRSLDDVLDVH